MLDNCVLELVREFGVCSEVRSVSWIPGAEGAPRGREDWDCRVAFEVVLVVLVAWEEEGAMRRDWLR